MTKLQAALITTAMLAVVALIVIVGALEAHHEYTKCTHNGGHWEQVDCHEVEDEWCTTTDWGNGMTTTSCFPTTNIVCTTVCIGANPEAQ